MKLFRKVQYCQNWNIGFCECGPEGFVSGGGLPAVKWLKHPYRDRWFADPFILRATEDEIVVFVEECRIEDNPKGIICELVIDRKTMRLRERYVLLELDTHLSYPAVIESGGKVYVYPENGASGKLNMYEYDAASHRLVNPRCILEEAVADATIVEAGGRFLMSATRFPHTQDGAYLYDAPSLFGPFVAVGEAPYASGTDCSRQGGNFFRASGALYRPAQDCTVRYGGSLAVMKSGLPAALAQERAFIIAPPSRRYPLGVHTLNFKDGLCVVDAYGYYYPFLGKLYYSLVHLLRRR